MFPPTVNATTMRPDRRFEDCYGPDLEYIVNDTSKEKNSILSAATQERVVSHSSKHVMKIDCKCEMFVTIWL